MKYFLIILLLITVAVVALFVIDHSAGLMLSAIAVLIVGYFIAVATISKE